MSLADDARRLNLRARRRQRRDENAHSPGAKAERSFHLPALILLTDERHADPLAAAACLPRGSAVILRHYSTPKLDRLMLARALRTLTRERGVLLLIAAGDRGGRDLAHAVGADGIHLPEWMVRRTAWPIGRARKPHWWITAAAHSPVGLRLAAARGADAALLSPVFPTSSHPGARALGPLRFAAWARGSRIPVYAMGGIDERTAARLRSTVACGLAGISAFGLPAGEADLSDATTVRATTAQW